MRYVSKNRVNEKHFVNKDFWANSRYLYFFNHKKVWRIETKAKTSYKLMEFHFKLSLFNKTLDVVQQTENKTFIVHFHLI